MRRSGHGAVPPASDRGRAEATSCACTKGESGAAARVHRIEPSVIWPTKTFPRERLYTLTFAGDGAGVAGLMVR
jgi:hypothetical protein